MLLNIRSLRSNLLDFLAKVVGDGHKPDIIVLTEIWIYEHEVATYGIEGYNAYFNCQEKNRAGGVAIYVFEKIQSVHLGNHCHSN